MRKLILFLLVCCHSIAPAQNTKVRMNMIGYPTGLPKKALLMGKKDMGDEVLIRELKTGLESPVTLQKSKGQPWPPFESYMEADLSRFDKPGDYLLHDPKGSFEDVGFHIGPYPALQEKVIRFMQTQRCGFNPWINEVCHPLDGRSFYGNRPDSSYVDATGGWHDAGDQLKYLITGSNATARMIMAWEWNPKAFADQTNELGLPQANGIADVLDEARWGLEWIHKLHPSKDELIHQVADDRDHLNFKMPNDDPANYGWGPNKYRPAMNLTGC